MDVKRPLFALLTLLFASCGFSAEWTTDYDGAVAAARVQDRAVFLFFTGSDWCGWCMKLDSEVLSTPEFAGFAKQNLILVKIDFPHRRQLPAAEQSRNQELARRYGVEGYPTVVVLDRNGRTAGQLGYIPGGPRAFVGEMTKLSGITWRPSSPAQVGGPASAPGKPQEPVPLFNGAPLRGPKRFDRVQLSGILGTKGHPMVIVNNQTLTPGESARVPIGDQRVKVTCKEIRAKSAIVIIEGNPVPQELFME